MSKIAPLIAQYLQEHKSVNIEGFGRFYVNENAGYVDPSEKNAPPVPIQYEYNTSVKTDEEFLTYIVQQTGKIKPLAIADLDTYISLSKQLLNISKPLVIDGVGTLNKVTAGHYEFIPGIYEAPKISTDNDRDRRLRQAKDNIKESAVSFDSSYGVEPKNNGKGLLKKVLGALTLLLLLGGIGFALYKFVFSKTEDGVAKTETKATAKPTTTDTTTKKDTTKPIQQIIVSSTPDSLGRVDFKLVVRTTDSAGAYTRAAKLKSADYEGAKLNAIVEKNSTDNRYNVLLLLKINPIDTAAKRLKMQADYGTPGQLAYYTN